MEKFKQGLVEFILPSLRHLIAFQPTVLKSPKTTNCSPEEVQEMAMAFFPDICPLVEAERKKHVIIKGLMSRAIPGLGIILEDKMGLADTCNDYIHELTHLVVHGNSPDQIKKNLLCENAPRASEGIFQCLANKFGIEVTRPNENLCKDFQEFNDAIHCSNPNIQIAAISNEVTNHLFGSILMPSNVELIESKTIKLKNLYRITEKNAVQKYSEWGLNPDIIKEKLINYLEKIDRHQNLR